MDNLGACQGLPLSRDTCGHLHPEKQILSQPQSLPAKQLLDHGNAGVGLCPQLPNAAVRQKIVDKSPDKNIPMHFVFTRPSNASEFEARDRI